MIPNVDVLLAPIEEVTYPTRTYEINTDRNRINGYTDDLDALIQAIYLILNTERYDFIIYSWDYGVELVDLIGKPMPYVRSEVERRISDALLQDDRINEVTNFEFEQNGKKLRVTFDVITDYGTVHAEKELFSQTSDPNVVDTLVWLDGGIITSNFPLFHSNDVLLVNDLPTLDENGVLIY